MKMKHRRVRGRCGQKHLLRVVLVGHERDEAQGEEDQGEHGHLADRLPLLPLGHGTFLAVAVAVLLLRDSFRGKLVAQLLELLHFVEKQRQRVMNTNKKTLRKK